MTVFVVLEDGHFSCVAATLEAAKRMAFAGSDADTTPGPWEYRDGKWRNQSRISGAPATLVVFEEEVEE